MLRLNCQHKGICITCFAGGRFFETFYNDFFGDLVRNLSRKSVSMDVPAFSFVESDILLLLNFLRFASLWKEQRLKQFRTICIFDICQWSACSPPLRSFIIIFMERDLSDSQNSPHKGRRKTFGLLHKMINVLFSSKCNSKK